MIFFIHYLITSILNINYNMKFPFISIKKNLNLPNNLDNIQPINLFTDNYKKTITYSKFLKEKQICQIFKNNYDIISTNFYPFFF